MQQGYWFTTYSNDEKWKMTNFTDFFKPSSYLASNSLCILTEESESNINKRTTYSYPRGSDVCVNTRVWTNTTNQMENNKKWFALIQWGLLLNKVLHSQLEWWSASLELIRHKKNPPRRISIQPIAINEISFGIRHGANLVHVENTRGASKVGNNKFLGTIPMSLYINI